MFTIVFLLLGLSSLKSQLNVDFSASVTKGCPPFIVEFENLTPKEQSASFFWDFGNGKTSEVENPVVIYEKPGKYSVTLTITYDSELFSKSYEELIEVYEIPVVNFIPNIPQAGCAPYNVKFQGQIESEEHQYNYTWDFGDGNIAGLKDPIHTYSFPGEYTVSLIVQDENGCLGKVTKEKLVRAQKPTSAFKVNNTTSCEGELNADFSNLSYGYGALTYSWFFGDGNYSYENNPMHHYNSEGTFDVALKVEDDLGCTDSIQLNDLIYIENTFADFSIVSDTICPEENIQLTNLSINNRTNSWSFGDNTKSELINPNHTYSQSGDYFIKLSITNYECKDSLILPIHVENVSPDFETTINYACEVPVEITYSPNHTNYDSYKWKFGNGNTSEEISPVNIFGSTPVLSLSKFEQYSDTLLVVSNYGCVGSKIKSNHITIQLPSINLTHHSPISGCIPLEVSLQTETDYKNNKDSVIKYSWFLNDEFVGSGLNYKETFTKAEINKIKVIAETKLGCLTEKVESISVGEIQEVDFTVKDKNTFCANELVEFEIISETPDLITSSDWKFGDGNVSAFGLPVHQYTQTGYMDVTLNAFHNGCPSKVIKNDYVYINGPIVTFQKVVDCNQPYFANLMLDLKDVDSYALNWGDGTSITNSGNEISHTYDEQGTYRIVIEANNNNGCSYTYGSNIYITQPKAVYDTIKGTPCVNNEIIFDPRKSENEYFFVYQNKKNKYLWDFGDNSTLKFTDEETSHIYEQPGIYYPKLVIHDINDCPDTISSEIEIFQPDVKFSSNYLNGCIPFSFEFTDLSASKNEIEHWNWDFGDGSQSVLSKPIHDYSDFGNFNVSLTITDSKGCSAKKVSAKEIQVIKPDASFMISDNKICTNDTILFYDTSKSTIKSFLWNFGDGKNSTIRNPYHSYKEEGEYTVSLKIIDEYGCTLTKTVDNLVNVQIPPKASFSSPITESTCYPFTVQFNNESLYRHDGGYQHWFFGDNLNVSNLNNPQHIYTKPGTYDVSLVAYSSNGCPDTSKVSDFIEINGPYAEINLVDTACFMEELSYELKNTLNISDITWDFGDGIISNESSTTHAYSLLGTFYPLIILKDSINSSCNKIFKDSVFIIKTISDFSVQDELYSGCVPFEIQTINKSKNASEYTWEINNIPEENISEPYLRLESSGEQSVKLIAQNKFNCLDSIVKKVTVYPLPDVNIKKDTLICEGDEALLWAEGGISYNWNNISTLDYYDIDSPIAKPMETTIYHVVVGDKNNCFKADSVEIKVQHPPVVHLKDTTIIIGEQIDLNIYDESIGSYFWKSNSGITCQNCPDPTIQPLYSTNYIVEVTDTSNCFSREYSSHITVEEKYSINLPEAFTPNNDNLNDEIYVKGWGLKELVYYRIFNKSGICIFETNDIHRGWDGTYKGVPQNADVYNYVTEVITYSNKRLTKKGSILLIR